MTKNNSDQFAKQFLEEVLSPFGSVKTSYEVSGEPQWVDVFFVPTAEVKSQGLGLLGQMVQQTCLIEPYRNPPTADEVRSCLLKLFQVQGNVRRQMRRQEVSPSENPLPFLWILASSASEALLQEFGAVDHLEWPNGVYLCPSGFKTAIISINKLPQTDETLWLRLLGKGQTQREAITQVLSFDPEDPRRSAILRLVTNWKISIEVTQHIEAQEAELLMALSQAYLEWERSTERRGEQRGRQAGIQEGRQAGIQEGRQEGELTFALRLIIRRFGMIAPETEAKIRSLSLTQLEELGEALLDFFQSSELEDWLERNYSR